jgi:hypothetical protein
MKVQEFLKLNGERKTAEKLVNMRVQFVMGLSMSDLPDSTQLWDIVESVEEELKEGEDTDYNKVKDLLKEITFEFIEEICW